MTRQRYRIAIATNGRFHVLDLARELAALGHEVLFYSLLPDSRAEKFGLSRQYCRSVFAPMVPALAWEHLGRKHFGVARERFHNFVLNRAIIARLEPCDIFIGVSGLILEAAIEARNRYGARVFVERGSKHILAQKEILASTGSGPSDYAVTRELESYAQADRIVIPADHVARSFAAHPGSAEKLLINPYGVDLDRFPRRTAPASLEPTILFVGGWQYRKGVDVLTRAVQQLGNVRFVHVGALDDHPFPDDPRFVHVEPVDQHQLSSFYGEAHVFAIASREEGLALVQLQALASGLPLVCSDQTGGRDLKLSGGLSARIDEVPVEDVDALAAMLRSRLERRGQAPAISDEDREALSWRRYAERYEAMLDREMASGSR